MFRSVQLHLHRRRQRPSLHAQRQRRVALGHAHGGNTIVVRHPGLLRNRANFNGCSSEQQAGLTAAVYDTYDYATVACSYLDSFNDDTPRYNSWFGAFDGARHATVLSHFQNIFGNDFAAFTYDCTCTDAETFAYVYPDDFGTVYLCGAFWNSPAVGSDSKAGTLVHESDDGSFVVLGGIALHCGPNGGTQDYAYGQADAQELARSDPGKAVFNADNHEYFAENTPEQE